MKIKIPLSKLREFLDYSKFTPTEISDVQPILKYVKFEILFGSCVMTKTNSKGFFIFNFDISDIDDIEFLLEESRITLLCSTTKSDFVYLSVDKEEKGDFVTIIDGKWRVKCNSGGYTTNDFNKIPEINQKGLYRLDKTILSCLDVAKIHSGKDDIRPAFNYVYLKDRVIYASNGSSMYYKEFNKDFPFIALSQDECNLLSNFNYIDYSISENYNTYKFNNSIWGYIQPVDGKGFNYNFVLSNIKRTNYTSISVENLMTFCKSTLKFDNGKFKDSQFSVNKENITLKYINESTSEQNVLEENIALIGEPFSFGFNPQLLIDIVSRLPYDKINIGDEGQAISIWNDQDNGYIGVLGKTKV